jgi:hypothetical protein
MSASRRRSNLSSAPVGLPGGVRRSLLALALSIIFVALFATGASAAALGGWNHVGTGPSGASSLNGTVGALITGAPGVLYVGGNFINAGGKANADRIASWNGSAWSALGPTLNGAVRAIAYHQGKVYAGGVFTDAGNNTNADFLAVWDGVSWAPFCNGGPGPSFGASVNALQIIGSTLYVGGAFQNGADIASADGLLACDLTTGASSSPFDSEGDGTGNVYTLTADSDGALYAGGTFSNLAGESAADFVAMMDGGGWHALGSGPNGAVAGIVRSLATNGTDIFIGTDASDIAGIAQADHVAKWNGSSFSAMGSNTGGANGWFPATTFIYGMTTSDSLVFATGSFQNANADPLADNVAYFDGNAWHPLGSSGAGNGPWIGDGLALATFRHQLYAGGGFTSAGGDTKAQFAASYPILRPDARIGTNAAGPFAGNGVYNATGVGQSKTISVARGHSGTLFLNFQNDGLLPDTLTITGTGTATGFAVTYFRGTTNVTSQVKAGTYSTGSLAPGASRTLKMVVKLTASSANVGSFLVKARSLPGTAPDAVKATVKAT